MQMIELIELQNDVDITKKAPKKENLGTKVKNSDSHPTTSFLSTPFPLFQSIS